VRAGRPAPLRSCVACRTVRDKRELVRVVRKPDGTAVLDRGGRVPGRGAYLCDDTSCWALALKRRAIERALEITLPTELREQLAARTTTTAGDAPAPTNRAETIPSPVAAAAEHEGGMRGT
jgi:uncharacterized protein